MTAHDAAHSPRPQALGPTAKSNPLGPTPKSILHITNGDSTRLSLEQSGVPGTFQPWRDVLHDGPVQTRLPLPEFRRIRSAFIASGGFSDAATIERGYEREDEAIASWDTRDETILWFEHDLYDQLLLIRVLSMLPVDAGRKVSLVNTGTYLGMLPPSAFPPLFASRRPVTRDQVALGSRAWHAYGDETPLPLLNVLDSDTSALPFLDGALRRLFQDYPDEHGLSRTERQILSVLEDGPMPWRKAFVACNAMEERTFMGDWTFRGVLADLARGPAPLLKGDVELTGAGRNVLAGRADRIALNGIDRWLGGVHLVPERPWRRPPGSARPAAS